MVNRPAGGARSKRWERMDRDFYREPRWVVAQLFDAISFGSKGDLDVILDPCCGVGTILDEAKARGHIVHGTDIVDRGCKHPFTKIDLSVNILTPPTLGRKLSVVCNPPYSYEPNMGERVIRRVLDWMPVHRAAFIVPIAFLCSERRWEFFARDYNPSHILICSQRPTMPPGDLIQKMPNPFEGGMSDFVWVVWTGPKHKWRTEVRWLKPTTK